VLRLEKKARKTEADRVPERSSAQGLVVSVALQIETRHAGGVWLHCRQDE
jgi:hypothetical protein